MTFRAAQSPSKLQKLLFSGVLLLVALLRLPSQPTIGRASGLAIQNVVRAMSQALGQRGTLRERVVGAIWDSGATEDESSASDEALDALVLDGRELLVEPVRIIGWAPVACGWPERRSEPSPLLEGVRPRAPPMVATGT